MQWQTVRFDDEEEALVVGSESDGSERIVHRTDGDEFIAHLDDLASASATSLRRALQPTGFPVLIADVDYDQFDSEYSMGGPITIEVQCPWP